MRIRKTRLAVIIDILTHNNIGCQDELSKQLALRGHIVTQATLSRDLKKLRTVKVASDNGGYRYIVASNEGDDEHNIPLVSDIGSMRTGYHPAAVSLRLTGNLAVIKTRNGYAGGLAYDIDLLASDYILGTIPGADTVFVAFDEKISRQDIISLFESILPYKVTEEARKLYLKEVHNEPRKMFI